MTKPLRDPSNRQKALIQQMQDHLALGRTFQEAEQNNQEPIQKILKEDFFQGTFEISIKRVKIK